MLGVSRQRVHQLMAQEDFPAPTVSLSSGHVWERAVIEEWIEVTTRQDDEP